MARQVKVSVVVKKDLRDRIQQLANPEITRQVSRSAALAGAKVFSQYAKEIVRVYKGPVKYRYSNGKKGKPIVPGEIRDAIYHAFNPEQSVNGKQSYTVSWNTSKVGFAHMIEFGHVVKNQKNGPILGFAPPYPFIRKSFEKKDEAFARMRERALDRFNYLFRQVMAGKTLASVDVESE